MKTADLQAQEASLKSQISSKLKEISADDTDLNSLMDQLHLVQSQLVTSRVADQMNQEVIDRTNRITDASQGTSAR